MSLEDWLLVVIAASVAIAALSVMAAVAVMVIAEVRSRRWPRQVEFRVQPEEKTDENAGS